MLIRAAVTLLLLGVAPLAAQQDYMARARPILGCWTVSVASFAPGPGRDSAWIHPPRIMRVDTTPGQGMMDGDSLGWLISTAAPPSEPDWRGAVLLGRADSLELYWRRGLGMLSALVKLQGDTARGRITLTPDTGDFNPSAQLTMIRRRCP